MNHHLSRDVHRAIHDEHLQRDGTFQSREIMVEVPLANFHGVEHQLIVQTHALQQHHRARQAHVDMTIGVCVTCGFVVHTICHHGLSYWTHRRGCSKFDANLFDPPLPEGLYQTYDKVFHPSQAVDSECRGCLLVCPVCKVDGT